MKAAGSGGDNRIAARHIKVAGQFIVSTKAEEPIAPVAVQNRS
jgi:hypothetical protein